MLLRMANPDAASADDIRRLCGDILDWKVDAILASGATVGDLEVALARLTGADDLVDEAGLPLDGRAAIAYDILGSEEDFPGDESA
jgi:hypothetical protein